MERARLTGGSKRQRMVVARSRRQVGGNRHRPTTAGLRLKSTVPSPMLRVILDTDWPFILYI